MVDSDHIRSVREIEARNAMAKPSQRYIVQETVEPVAVKTHIIDEKVRYCITGSGSTRTPQVDAIEI